MQKIEADEVVEDGRMVMAGRPAAAGGSFEDIQLGLDDSFAALLLIAKKTCCRFGEVLC